jgi:hypothetical protein
MWHILEVKYVSITSHFLSSLITASSKLQVEENSCFYFHQSESLKLLVSLQHSGQDDAHNIGLPEEEKERMSGMAQVVESLPCKCEDLSSTQYCQKTKNKTY